MPLPLAAIQPVHVLLGLICLAPFIVAGLVAGLTGGFVARRRR